MNSFQAKNTWPVILTCVLIETNRVPSRCKDLQGCQIKTCYGQYGVGSYLDANERRKNKGGTASSPTISLERKSSASISLWELILAFCRSFELAWFESNFDTSVGEADSGGRAFQRNGRLPRMQRLRDYGVNVCKSIGLEDVAKEERPCFGARLNVNLAQGGRGQRVQWVGRSLGVFLFASAFIYCNTSLGRLTLADDAASFPPNRSTMTTMTSDNGSGFTVPLVRAVWSRRVFSSILINTSARPDKPTGHPKSFKFCCSYP